MYCPKYHRLLVTGPDCQAAAMYDSQELLLCSSRAMRSFRGGGYLSPFKSTGSGRQKDAHVPQSENQPPDGLKSSSRKCGLLDCC
jgi:hypothetical protein